MQKNENVPYIGGSTYRMPYGKFKGHMLCVVPESYLEWLEKELVTSGKNTSDELIQNINQELKKRGKK